MKIAEIAPDPQLCQLCKSSPLPVQTAAKSGHIECLKGLLSLDSQQPDANNQLAVDAQRCTALHVAAETGRVDALKLLLEHGRIATHSQDTLGRTCAICAAEKHHLDCVKTILGDSMSLQQALALAVQKDNDGNTVLHVAVIVGDNDIALWLLKRFGKAIANEPNKHRLLPLHIAAGRGNIEFIRIATKYDGYMVNQPDKDGSASTFYAVQSGHLPCLKYLIEKARGDLRAITTKGQSLLHAACLSGHLQVVNYLLARLDKLAVFSQTTDLATPFHCAAFGGHDSVLEQLYKASGKLRKAIPALKDRRGNTPLHLAAMATRNAAHCVKFLLDVGSDPTAVNAVGNTPLDIAERKENAAAVAVLSKACAICYTSEKRSKKFFHTKKTRRKEPATATNLKRPTGVLATSGYGSSSSRHGALSSSPLANRHTASANHLERSSGYGSSQENMNKSAAKTTPLRSQSANSSSMRPTASTNRLQASQSTDQFLLRKPEPSAPAASFLGFPSLFWRHSRSHQSHDELSRSFFDSACQTDPDMLHRDTVLVEDDSETTDAIPQTTELEGRTSERDFRRESIAALEQIDRILEAESSIGPISQRRRPDVDDGRKHHARRITTVTVHHNDTYSTKRSDDKRSSASKKMLVGVTPPVAYDPNVSRSLIDVSYKVAEPPLTVAEIKSKHLLSKSVSLLPTVEPPGKNDGSTRVAETSVKKMVKRFEGDRSVCTGKHLDQQQCALDKRSSHYAKRDASRRSGDNGHVPLPVWSHGGGGVQDDDDAVEEEVWL